MSDPTPSTICNWCGHPKLKHASAMGVAAGAGCLFVLRGTEDYAVYCQCTAHRGVVRMPRKAAK